MNKGKKLQNPHQAGRLHLHFRERHDWMACYELLEAMGYKILEISQIAGYASNWSAKKAYLHLKGGSNVASHNALLSMREWLDSQPVVSDKSYLDPGKVLAVLDGVEKRPVTPAMRAILAKLKGEFPVTWEPAAPISTGEVLTLSGLTPGVGYDIKLTENKLPATFDAAAEARRMWQEPTADEPAALTGNRPVDERPREQSWEDRYINAVADLWKAWGEVADATMNVPVMFRSEKMKALAEGVGDVLRVHAGIDA